MRGLWRHRRGTDLEQRLRAERPEPPETFVRMVVERTRSHERRSLAPRLAVVGALTAVMLVALGAAGSLGYASTAISGFTSSIHDVVFTTNAKKAHKATVSTPSKPSTTGESSSAGNGNAGGNGNDASTSGGGQPFNDTLPFQHQYGFKIPVCHNGKNTLFLPLPAVVAHLLHGDTPGPCPG